MTNITLLKTFYTDLNRLKLDQFPCGKGSWRQDKLPEYTDDGDVNHETLQSLEELSRSDIFQVQSSWSDDIKDLRELAVKSPGIITENFIFQHFKTLRLIDRNINEVDRGLLKFTNLEQLSLTGNSLVELPGSNLPRCLSVLQLFANKFTDLVSLTVNPPPNLQHLGLGYNQLTDITPSMSPYYWPNLLSLDLSHNKIARLRPTVECLATLPSLRNLSLMGNPINLAPGYTGCLLDSLLHLNILDDTSISDDDRLNFTGISQEEVAWDQAIITVSFPSLENLRPPPENEALDEAAFLYPNQKKYSYLIRFLFASDSTPQPVDCAGPVPTLPLESGDKATTAPAGASQFETVDLPWDEGKMAFGTPVIIRCSDLAKLGDFLGEEIQFTVVEKVVESWTVPAPPDPTSVTPPPSSSKKRGGAGKEDKKKKKPDAGGEKIIKDKDGNILKWENSQPTYSEIAHIKTSIKSLIEATSCEGVVECTVTEKPLTPAPDSGRDSVLSTRGGKKKEKGGKKGKAPTPVADAIPTEPLRLEYQLSRVEWLSGEDQKRWTLNC